MRCIQCGADMDAKTARRRYCSARCRAAAWQRARGEELALVEVNLTRALTRVRRLRVSGKESA